MSTMLRKIPIYLILIVFVFIAYSFAEAYDRNKALVSIINPHEQINDEGEILWKKCMICHLEVPDIKKAKDIKDVKLRFEEDMKQMCFRCHPQRMHPGGGWAGQLRGRYGAPIHWIKPPEYIAKNMKISIDQYKIYLPVEPKTGKIFCATCHNPHERGLLIGKADYGADYDRRLRSAGRPICNYCHRR
jgi:hypothetical protein